MLPIYRERDIVGHVRNVSPSFLDSLATLRDDPLVGDVRGVGLIAGIELMADKTARLPFPPERQDGRIVEAACLRAGLIVRAIGYRIALSPPLIITEDEIATLVVRLRQGLDMAWREIGEAKAAVEELA
jgi:4-aminobutyrate--pyruvate transaminase